MGGRAVKEFSMFEHALKAAGSGTLEDLGDVANISRTVFDAHPTIRFRTQAPCMEYLSLLIENALLLRTHRAGRIYVGFEKLSCMKPVADRYLRIADISEHVYAFGEADWTPPRHPNMKFVKIDSEMKLARELFVIADSPVLRMALVGIDEDGFDAQTHDERNFRAFKSHDPFIVSQLAKAAENLIDAAIGN